MSSPSKAARNDRMLELPVKNHIFHGLKLFRHEIPGFLQNEQKFTDSIIILCDSQATGTGDIAYGTVKIISGLLFIALGWLTIRNKKKKEEEKN